MKFVLMAVDNVGRRAKLLESRETLRLECEEEKHYKRYGNFLSYQ